MTMNTLESSFLYEMYLSNKHSIIQIVLQLKHFHNSISEVAFGWVRAEQRNCVALQLQCFIASLHDFSIVCNQQCRISKFHSRY
jgi:hypothetical protein